MLVVVALLYLFFNSLAWLTNHGKQTVVPSLEGKSMKEAVDILENKGFDVTIDSTFQSYKHPLEVIFQEPAAGSVVKYGRTIFLTVNRQTPPSIPMPNLVGISFRNALLTMQSFRLSMGDTIYKPDLATGSVLEQQFKGRVIAPGTMVPIGSKIDLVIAEGFSGAIDVPNLVGLSWQEASTILDSLILTPNAIWEGEISDSSSAIIYAQTPAAINELDFKNSINRGDLIDLRIMQNPSAELLQKNQGGSQTLLGDDETALKDSNEAPVTTIRESQLNASKQQSDSLKKKKGSNDNVPIGSKDKPKDNLSAQKKEDLKNKKTDNSVIPAKPADKKPKPKSGNPVINSEDQTKNEYE